MKLFCQNCNKCTPHTIERERSTSFLGKICELLLGGYGYSNSYKNIRCKVCGTRYNKDLHETTYFDDDDHSP